MQALHPIWHRDADAILHKALKTWGQHEQEQMAFGECGEFVALAALKVQGRLTTEAVVDEIADVTIMMRQMAHLYGLAQVEERIRFKLDRLAKKLERHQA
ncbi:hypothetical protein [Geothrix sp. 21YS21S-2]|uniref:hypothetical protein n=1 Tax=Geothrix sp. 21YS21S-2 TaxID=3068893 RepID=UPI0027B9ED20|nr:hypothetical protein [Geothrix sp. 21YS21S-2]